ncbi:MAG: diguanylate cyclase (GGDEF)-like protein [Paraglaciecola sp.]|jgi:diguanylate cyclase (GGDEF)-like protein
MHWRFFKPSDASRYWSVYGVICVNAANIDNQEVWERNLKTTLDPIVGVTCSDKARILVVDDQPINIQIINQILIDDYQVFFATSGNEALDFCMKTPPDMVLMDVVMPEMDGLTTCQIMKKTPELATIPVIFVTALQKQNEENACWEAGGIDYLIKPVNPVTLRNRVKAHITLKFQTDFLKKMVYLDGLTGVYNRRYFDDFLQRQVAQAKRSDQSLALLMVDIDYFKQFNDQYGHLSGDDQLNAVAQCLAEVLRRPTDIVARYGGEEFACVLPYTDFKGARYIAQELVDSVSKLGIPHKLSPYHKLTISVGLAVVDASINSTEDLVSEADKQLYKAKKTGRNRFIG